MGRTKRAIGVGLSGVRVPGRADTGLGVYCIATVVCVTEEVPRFELPDQAGGQAGMALHTPVLARIHSGRAPARPSGVRAKKKKNPMSGPVGGRYMRCTWDVSATGATQVSVPTPSVARHDVHMEHSDLITGTKRR